LKEHLADLRRRRRLKKKRNRRGNRPFHAYPPVWYRISQWGFLPPFWHRRRRMRKRRHRRLCLASPISTVGTRKTEDVVAIIADTASLRPSCRQVRMICVVVSNFRSIEHLLLFILSISFGGVHSF
jgi:hypothetical protein